jgi:ATP-dependent RNA circularization protein (DNA/RNA ligase family)
VQNLYGKIPEGVYQIEEKLEGSSMTIYWDGETVGVTSRNVDLKIEQEGNAYVDEARKTGLLEILPTIQGPIAIRGELIGNGVQGNIYKMHGTEFRVFDIYFEGRYLNPSERDEVIAYLRNLGAKFFEVPILGEIEFFNGMEDLLITMADGKSAIHDTLREGLVFKGNGFSFKSVSKKYLEQEK